jgi:16S rRNA (guanine527-N7)-methyltransferase
MPTSPASTPPPPSDDLRERAAAVLGGPLSTSQVRQLETFEELLLGRGSELGVISKRDAGRVRERHVLDCLRAAVPVQPSDRSAYDLGSGGGLPGLVVAIVVPRLQVTCVEARRNRVAFLELAIDRLGLPNAHAWQGRIEGLEAPVDLCFARALADPATSWRLAQPLLLPEGRLIYFAGKGFRAPPPDREGGRQGSHAPRKTLLHAVGLESAGPVVIMGRP